MATFTCQRCGKAFEARQRKRLYCSRKCANALAGERATASSPKRYFPCETCGAPVYSPPGYQGKRGRFCSRTCRGVAMRGKPAAGAMVPGNSGVGLSGFRPDLGHFCRSRWEANYARYLLHTGHAYEYEPTRFVIPLDDGSEHGYTPDFLVDGTYYVEVKGWMRPNRRQAEIIAAAQEQLPHPLMLVDADAYREIARLNADTIPGWEHSGDPKPELPKRTCPECGKIVTSIFLKTKYCSRACFGASGRKPKEQRVCPTCSTGFDVSPHQADQVYCSQPCWYAALKSQPRHDKMWQGPLSEEQRERLSQAQLRRSGRTGRIESCQRCGSPLSRSQKRDRAKYCSHACYVEAWRGKRVGQATSEETRAKLRAAWARRKAT